MFLPISHKLIKKICIINRYKRCTTSIEWIQWSIEELKIKKQKMSNLKYDKLWTTSHICTLFWTLECRIKSKSSKKDWKSLVLVSSNPTIQIINKISITRYLVLFSVADLKAKCEIRLIRMVALSSKSYTYYRLFKSKP